MTTRFGTVSGFVQQMKNGALTTPIELYGLVKADEAGSEDVILYSPKADCSRWFQIPEMLVESIEFEANVRCKDHYHPFVKITLKIGADPIYAALAQLLQFHIELGKKTNKISPGCGFTCQACKAKCATNLTACSTACETFAGPLLAHCLEECGKNYDSCMGDC